MRPSPATASQARDPLPHPLPESEGAQTALFLLRRLGAHGLRDAVASESAMRRFGRGFRRPLALFRAMMADLAASATCPISIAPCCCRRVTAAEHAVLTVLSRAEHAPETARILLQDLLAARHVDGVLACVTAVATAFADMGRPIRM